MGGPSRRLNSTGLNPGFEGRAHGGFKPEKFRLAVLYHKPKINMVLISTDNTSKVRLISLAVYALERKPLRPCNITDNRPTGIACPVCHAEIYANTDIEVKPGRVPAWCSSYFCPWRGALRVYNEKDTV